MKSIILLSLLCLITGCAAPATRTISGKLVRSGSYLPVANQQLVLDRPPGDYEGIPIPLTGVPQPVTIATATTNARGQFTFSTTKDRKRSLQIRLAGSAPFGSYGYAVAALKDSLSQSPQVSFDPNSMHKPGGGFESTP